MITPIRIDNFPDESIKARTLIDNTGGVAAGATSIAVQNSASFAIGDHVLIGPLGSNECEEVVLAAAPPNANTITVPALTFAHNEYEDVVAIKYNQIKVYTAAALSTGEIPPVTSFTLLTTLPITVNQQYTDYVDPAGTSSIWYAWTYYNATGPAETNFNENERVIIGADANTYCTIDDIRKQSGLENNPWITDYEIALERSKSQEEIDSKLYTMYNVPFESPVPYIIQDIAIRLTAGRLLIKDYGTDSTGSSKDGDLLLKDARVDLLDIDEREMVVLDAAGQSLLVEENAAGVSSWPNNTTQVFTNSGPGNGNGSPFDTAANPGAGYDFGHIVGMATRF